MSGPLYYAGANEAIEKLEDMNRDELLEVLDNLYGRAALRFGATDQEILFEAQAQTWRDFRVPYGEPTP